MKKLLLFLLVAVTFKSYAQSDGKARSDRDSIPVEYPDKPSNRSRDHTPAYFENGQFLQPFAMQTINPNEIKSLDVVRRDTVIAGKKYYGMIFLELKNDHPPGYVPKMITLNRLKDRHTSLQGKPALFTIDGKLVNADYDTYRVDQNNILKIIIEPFTDNNTHNPSWLVKILTKTKENIEKANQIRIRGLAGLSPQPK